jgi:CDP-glucose 4,6-dehydratase
MGTVHLLEAIRQVGHPCVVVNVTSDKCYANREWVWGYREDEPMGGHDPYSNSKGCAELVTASFRDSYFPADSVASHGVAVASARAGNAVGGGDWTANQLIPDLIRAFIANRPCAIRSPAAIRPWQFVLEPLHGYLCLAEQLAKNPSTAIGGWNFGPADADAQPVAWIADQMTHYWARGAQWRLDELVHPPEAHFLKLDASKSRTHLGWRPVLPLDQALAWIVEWYKAFEGRADLRFTTIDQITQYRARLRADAGHGSTKSYNESGVSACAM